MYNRYNDCSETYPVLTSREIKHEYDCDSQSYGNFRGQQQPLMPNHNGGSIMKLLQDPGHDVFG